MTKTYYFRRKVLSSRGISTLKDANGNVCYILSGRWGMMPAVLEVYDINDHRLAQIRQCSLGLLPKFELYNEYRQKVGSLRRYYHVGAEIHFVSGLNWVILGNSLNLNYKVFHGRELIMVVTQLNDFTSLQITASEYEPICICLAVILDFWSKTPIQGTFKNFQLNHKFGQLNSL